MKNILFTIFKVLIVLVLTGKIVNWFVNFSDETNYLLNTVMFCLIGISYLVMGYVWETKWVKGVAFACGLFIIVMNFLPKNITADIFGIACILIPMLIAGFYKEKDTS